MSEKIYAIRGAVSPVDDTTSSITENTVNLMNLIIEKNRLYMPNRIISVILSSTEDITAYYPAAALRTSGLTDAPLFSVSEPSISGGLHKTVRVMVLAAFNEENPEIHHIYLGDATRLRPDLSQQYEEDNK